MRKLKSIKIATAIFALIGSSSAFAGGSVVIAGQTFKTYDAVADYFYGIFGAHMSNAITSKTLSKLELSKLEGKFVFISPSTQFFRERYIIPGGWLNRGSDTELMIGYTEQLKAEMIFNYFEKMGLVDRFDIASDNMSMNDIERNYDYIVTVRSEFNGIRNAQAANARKTEYFVRNVKTGKEQKITETMGSPALVGLFESVAVKFSDAVKATS